VIFNPVDSTKILSPVPDGPEQDKLTLTQLSEKQLALSNLAGFIDSKYQAAKSARNPSEIRWMRAWKQFNGEPSEIERIAIAAAKKRNPTASDIFINITKTKALAAYGQICEILFGDERFPLTLEATPEPEGILKEAFLAPAQFPDSTPDIYGYEGDGQEIAPGATYSTLLGGIKDKVGKFLDAGRKLIPGISPDPVQMPQISPAEESAKRLDKVVQDQLAEQNVGEAVRAAALEAVIMGTGCLKRPHTHRETLHKWVNGDNGIEHSEEERLTPKPEFVTIWNIYPDPAIRRARGASHWIERHRLNRFELKKLIKQPFFIKSAIEKLLESPGNYTKEWWESTGSLSEVQDDFGTTEEWLVLEYTGYVEKEMLEYIDSITEEEKKALTDIVKVNIWKSGDQIIKVVLNPFVAGGEDYYLVPYEEQPNSPWGKGLPENMEDSQALINGHMRMAADNLKFAGSVMFEVNENYLVAGQDMSIYNGKIFRTNGGPPGQSIFAITTPNVANSNLQFVDKAMQMAEQSTGQQSAAYGQYSTGQTRTASGLSMLMQAASLTIKTVINNFDQYLIEPMGQAYFHWNMQFNQDIKEIYGDIKIVAKGTASLVQKEVQSQRLLTLLQVSANPMAAPFVNLEYVLKETVRTMGLDADKAVNDPAKAMLYAEIMGKLNNAINQGPSTGDGSSNPGGEQGSPQQAGGSPNPNDVAGGSGGAIQPGAIQKPGQTGSAG
jgi:hypothetical protein